MGRSRHRDRAAEGVVVAAGGDAVLGKELPTWLAFGETPEHEGALRVDVRPGVGDQVADIRALPFPDESFEGMECHHVLEHLLPWDAEDAAKELWRVLRPGGVLEASVPDLIECAKTLLTGNTEVLLNVYSPHAEPPLQHRWGYTPGAFRKLLEGAGFDEIEEMRRTEPHEVRMRAKKDIHR